MSYRGIGEYDHVKSFAWLYNPPPFDFLDPAGVTPPPQFYAPARTMGFSGLGCPGNPNCSCKCGMGDWSTVNWGLNSSDIAAQFGMTLPNWVLYAGLIGTVAIWKGCFSKHRR